MRETEARNLKGNERIEVRRGVAMPFVMHLRRIEPRDGMLRLRQERGQAITLHPNDLVTVLDS